MAKKNIAPSTNEFLLEQLQKVTAERDQLSETLDKVLTKPIVSTLTNAQVEQLAALVGDRLIKMGVMFGNTKVN